MKLILVSDLHLMGRIPVSRKDNFPETQFNKIKQIMKIAKKQNAIVLQAGDFFDSYNPSYRLINKYINLFGMANWYAVLGQHDLYMWNKDSIDRTALGVLESAGCVRILRDFVERGMDNHVIHIHGCSWGQEIPKIDSRANFNILVIHRNIGDKPLFPGHDLVSPKRFLNKHKFDLILCGDYHFPFECKIDNRLIINTGVICRKSITEKDIKPSIILYDTETKTHKWVPLDYKNDVFIEREEVSNVLLSNEKMTQFLKELRTTDNLTISFSDNVNKALKEVEVSSNVRDRITQVMNECEGGNIND